MPVCPRAGSQLEPMGERGRGRDRERKRVRDGEEREGQRETEDGKKCGTKTDWKEF